MRTSNLSLPEEVATAEWKRDLAQKSNGAHPELRSGHTAFDLSEAHLLLRGAFSDDELKRIRIVPHGSRLEDGAAYIDLLDPAREVIRATTGMTAEQPQLLVPQSEVDGATWERLTQQVPPGQTGG